jgi:cellulase
LKERGHASLQSCNFTIGLCAIDSKPWGRHVLHHRRRCTHRVSIQPTITSLHEANHRSAYHFVANETAGSIQRTWEWEGYVPESTHIACSNNGAPFTKSYHAPMHAGSTVTVDYKVAGDKWSFGHPYGPMMAYMAACPSEGCENVDLSKPIWFKIWQTGLLSGQYITGHWAMKEIYDGANLEIPTPASLKPGKYLLKHDMINLETGPVQIFPNCVQLDVSGSGSSVVDANELVAFPGGYDGFYGECSW